MAEIDRMIEVLKEEGQEDIEQRDWCIAEQNNQTNHKENLEYEISQLQARPAGCASSSGRSYIRCQKMVQIVCRSFTLRPMSEPKICTGRHL